MSRMRIKQAIQARGLERAAVVTPPSPKRLIAQQIEKAIAQQGLTRAEVAARMKTSRAALARLLDGDNPAVTLQTLEAAASALGLEVIITIRPKAKGGI
ncbi:MAG: helix-turn-helix transcriptional regulator [Alphaproteobacteria bacterium]|nr:helix-turn-helix transcriptional regulator [Alphaproteobacteria bacterium]